VKHMMLTS